MFCGIRKLVQREPSYILRMQT